MSLSCYCEHDFEPGDRFFFSPDDYSTLDTSRRKRCPSCGELIDIGAVVARFQWSKVPEYEVECAIYGEDGEVPLAPSYLCEDCADLYFSFKELGFSCVNPTENMRALAKEYAEIYGPQETSENGDNNE